MLVKFTSGKPYPEFEVFELNKMVIHLKIDVETQAFRITCRDNKRVFFIAEEVIRKNKITTLLNEYSIQLGAITPSKSDLSTGEMEFEGAQYAYRLSDDLRKEISLFEQGKLQPILTCKLETGQLSFLNEGYISYLLFSLVWYRFLTKGQPALSQFAEIR